MSEKTPFYITTPIYYPSGNPHIGHCYSTIACDVVARMKRMQGYDVMFLTGTDEHGQKIEKKAEELGITPKAYVDEIVANFKKLWGTLGITYDRFIRTTDDYHIESVQKIFKKLYDTGYIYKSEYKGKYCTPCESFWTESQLVDGKCPDCGREVTDASEEAYFFKLSQFAPKLKELLLDEEKDFLNPKSRVNEMINNFIEPGLQDLCVSRTSFTWGVPVDFDKGHIVYVWIDALSNYITALGYLNDTYHDYDKYWPADMHVMAKEIVRFHSLIWPAFLMALGEPLPKKVYGHGWLIVDGDKMSKSKGNVVDPIGLIDEFGADAIRYFLLREINLGQDGNFSRDALIQRINSDLANDLGNLLHRTLNMVGKFQDGVLLAPQGESEIDKSLKADAAETVAFFAENMDKMELSLSIKKVWAFISRANKYIDETAPWALAKDESKKQELANVMYNLAESLRHISVLISPFMPVTAERIWQQLNLPGKFADVQLDDIKAWGGIAGGHKVGTPEQLFPRIEVEKDEAPAKEKAAKQPKEKQEKKAKEQPAENGEISIDDFAKVQLRVVKVLAAEPVPKTEKLLKLKVDLGDEQREIVSGIAKHYAPADLIGKNVVMVINLKPAKIRGIVSHGMVLAASQGDDLKVLSVDMPVGSVVR